MPIAYASSPSGVGARLAGGGPAYGIVAGLTAALEATKDDRKQAEILVRWANQEVPTMLGILSTLLLAMHKGLDLRAYAPLFPGFSGVFMENTRYSYDVT